RGDGGVDLRDAERHPPAHRAPRVRGSGVRSRLRAQRGARRAGRRRDVELLRLRWDERRARRAPLQRIGATMHDLKAVDYWLGTRDGTQRDDVAPDTLPEPTSTVNGRQLVSFSSNNYLALATSPRMKAAARAALDRYGVGNCESRLLGGNLSLYDRLEA